MNKTLQVISLVLFFLIHFQVEGQLISNESFTTPSNGWYRVGNWGTSQRGSVRLVVSLRGGAHTPQSVIIDAFKDWSSGLHMDVKGIRNNYIEQVRITKENDNCYIEAYFDRVITGNSNIYLYNLEGSSSGFVISSGQLVPGGGTVLLESENIVSITQLDNTLDLKNDLSVNGKVLIGTTTTGSHKLAVEGSIGAREVKVEASGWSDFVFEDDYNLPSLKAVEKHIKEKGHLQDIPSADEVEENGINLGEMDAKLLQKIEELMLYTIEQQRDIELLKKENLTLKREIDKIKNN